MFHTGTQHSWQTALAFQETGQLAWYATSIFYDPEKWPYRIERFLPPGISQRLHREMVRRYTPLLDPALVRIVSHGEWLRSLVRRYKLDRLDHLFARANVRLAAQATIRLLVDEPVDALWCYNSQAEYVFSSSRANGLLKILDQTIGHPVAMDAALLPLAVANWSGTNYRRFSPKWVRIQNHEVALADQVMVGSAFCGDTMIANGCAPDKLTVLPYGYDDALAGAVRVRAVPAERPLKFIFVGTVEARKGAHLVIEAFRRIPPSVAEVTLVGRMVLPERAVRDLPVNIRHVPHVPRSAVGQYLASADCFIFPSFFEGSALVLYEALGAGLGIIQTKSAGFGVVDGVNGIMLAEATVETIHGALRRVIADPSLITRWSRESIRLSQDYRWSDYRVRCRKLVDAHFAGTSQGMPPGRLDACLNDPD